MPTVAVVIVSWNTRELLAECLASIGPGAAGLDVETAVIDNDSADGSAAMVRERFPSVRLVVNPRNVGFAPAVNQGIAATTAPFVLLLNSDARLGGDALPHLLARLESTPRAGLVGAQLRGSDGQFQYAHARFPTLGQEAMMLSGLGRLLCGTWYPSAGPTDAVARTVDWVGGACMLARRAALDAVGGLDEGFALYCEEVDLCLALRRAGWEVWYEPAAVIAHRKGASASQLGPEREAQLYRSRVRFFRKHYGVWASRRLAALMALLTLPKIALHGALRRMSGGRAGRPMLSVRALFDALSGEMRPAAAAGRIRSAAPGTVPRRGRPKGGTLLIATALAPDRADGVASARHPRVEYVELQRRTGVDVLDYRGYPRGAVGALIHRAETALHFDPLLTAQALARAPRYDRLLCLSERVGLPLAVLRRAGVLRVPLMMLFMAWSWRQESLVTRLGLFASMDCIAVNSSALREHLIRLGAPPERLHQLRWAVDHEFFAPVCDPSGGDGLVSIGEPRHRDYAALFRAVDGLAIGARVRMSGYMPRAVGGRALTPPPNVRLLPALTAVELRALYAGARMVVLPVHDTLYPAGLTSLLEAMSMARPVIVTRSRGLADYVVDGETALLVDGGDAAALRDAIRRLDADPALARRLGAAARARVEAELNQRRYVDQLAALLAGGPRREVAASPRRLALP